MNYRTVELLARETHTSDITKIIDIDLQDAISSLVIFFEGTNSQATMTAHPMAGITAIQIVDGSNVLYNLDGYEAEALDFYQCGGKLRSNYNYYINGGTFLRAIGINFGRWLWDRVLAFDPSRYRNPQLKITLDIDAGGNAPATVYLAVWANCFDERLPELRGFLSAKEIKEYTIASSTHEYTDLPVDFPYRNIYFRPFVAGTEPNQCVSNFKLSEDKDKRVPFDLGVQEIERALLAKYGAVEEHFFFVTGTSNRYVYVTPTTRVFGSVQPWKTTGEDEPVSVYDGDGGRLKTIVATAGYNTVGVVRGWVPHCVYQLPMGMADDMDDWFNPSRVSNLKADITGAATATGYLFAEQFMPY